MNKPHKWSELIKAWADGAEIEWREDDTADWDTVNCPMWRIDWQYRIKPEVKDEAYYLERLIELQSSTDTEEAHALADNYLCCFLQSLGYFSIVREYQKINKWYA